MGHGGAGEPTCGISELLVFAGALVAGTGCSIFSKMLLDSRSVGLSGVEQVFENPLFQTWGMFLGMVGSIPMHFLYSSIESEAEPEAAPTPTSTYFVLVLPALFDLFATALCMFGLMHINVSMYQMLRGGAIVFVAILKQFVLGDKLKLFMWVGVLLNVVSIVMVGATAQSQGDGGAGGTGHPLLGVALILGGAFVQSLQYAFEEKVMSADIGAPPLLVIGMEGLWGLVVCTFVLYPAAMYYGLEDPRDTWVMFANSRTIQVIFIFYFSSIFIYNMLAVLVTFQLNSVWHAILDNFRPITIWAVDLIIYYCITRGGFGEPWTAPGSFIQLAALFVLLYGTAVYNGSVKLPGFEYQSVPEEPFTFASPGILRAKESLLTSSVLQSPLIRNASLRAENAGILSPARPRLTNIPEDNKLLRKNSV